MASDFALAYRASRRSYELGRLGLALVHAAVAVALVGAVAVGLLGRSSLDWLPITFVATALAEWRGGFLLRGARRGMLAGLAALLLPLSVLRPCCGLDAKAMGVACCVMPSACSAAGALVGAAAALLLPNAPDRRLQASAGLLLGVVAVAVPRCSHLFLGETVGLLAGVAAGLVAVSAGRAWLVRA